MSNIGLSTDSRHVRWPICILAVSVFSNHYLSNCSLYTIVQAETQPVGEYTEGALLVCMFFISDYLLVGTSIEDYQGYGAYYYYSRILVMLL